MKVNWPSLTLRVGVIGIVCVLVAVVAAMPAASAFASDWPQWRGSGGSGVTADTRLPERWSQDDGLRWKIELPGRGLSSPIIVGDRIYLTACTGATQERLHVLCFNFEDGRKLWERQFWATGMTACHPKTSMAAPTPATDGERVYALFATNDLVCLDRDGTLVWYRSLARDYPAISNQVGMASSPVLWRDTLILSLETDAESFAFGIDKLTGENRWKVPRNRDINWTTPVLVRRGSRAEVLFQSRRDLTAYDPDTGEVIWSHTGSGLDPIASPAASEGRDGPIFAPAGDIVALRPGSAGEKPEVLWRSNKLRATTASPIVYQGRVYALNSVGVLTCADPSDGSVIWQERLKGPFSASPIAGDGKLYCVNEEGTTVVISTNSDEHIISTNPLGETILASPAISRGRVFLRSDKHLYCVGSNAK